MVKLMERKKIWFLISALLLVPGIISLIAWGLKVGIDFKGGTLAEYSTPAQNQQGIEQVKKAYSDEEIKDTQVQVIQSDGGETRYLVKAPTMSEDKHRNIVRRLKEQNPPVQELSFETTDPQVGKEVTRRAILAVIVASLAIIIYIAMSFRGVPKPASSWQFGVIAVVALLHDVLFILGFYSIMGHFFGYEVKADFITAALTVMGFSVHDTIVVFDRLRENLKRFPSYSFTQVANVSVTQTISRSINTSLTVVLTLLAVVLLGGESIRPFALTLLVGIVAGTYSSIFVATPLLDWWQTSGKRFKLPKRAKKSRLRTKAA